MLLIADMGGFLDYHISYGLEERPKNIVKRLMDFDFSGSDEEVTYFKLQCLLS